MPSLLAEPDPEGNEPITDDEWKAFCYAQLHDLDVTYEQTTNYRVMYEAYEALLMHERMVKQKDGRIRRIFRRLR